MTPERAPVVVQAAIIERDGRFLLTRRLRGTHLEGLWEFPGGKCEAGESAEACLVRELAEELGVVSRVGELVLETVHAYPERTVHLFFRRCAIEGDPQPLLNQQMRWTSREELMELAFPEADREVIRLLTQPASGDRVIG
jgi:mutator protein MutT